MCEEWITRIKNGAILNDSELEDLCQRVFLLISTLFVIVY